MSYWIPTSFRCLTDEPVALAQVWLIDDRRTVAQVARTLGVSAATVYRVRAAVPDHLIVVDHGAHRALRTRTRTSTRRRKAA